MIILLEIEDYELIFYANGRLATLVSKKEDGYSSALLWFKITDVPGEPDLENFEWYVADFRLGIRKGTDELVVIR